jgi:hypothetical protein
MTSIQEADAWIGRTAIDDTGEQIGLISQIWVDDTSGQAEWASVRGATLGGREAFVPLAGAAALGSGVQFTYTKEEVVDAPHVAQDGRLEAEEKEQLTSYYGAPAADAQPPARSASWVDRIDALIPAPGRGPVSSPVGADPAAAPREGRRFGRKPGKADKKAGRRFGRKSKGPDQAPASHPMEPDEAPIGA